MRPRRGKVGRDRKIGMAASKPKDLRSGYTTGACAAAAAKAATLILLGSQKSEARSQKEQHAQNKGYIYKDKITRAVDIPFPDGSRVKFMIHDAGYRMQEHSAYASIIKDAGDDPDVTNGAEIVAEVRIMNLQDSSNSPLVTRHSSLIIRGGAGVGIVTKPGLPVPVGEPAINPVPRKMILDAVNEAITECPGPQSPIPDSRLLITISVPKGEELAKKTLNSRLGIIGGISILGTSGIVKPLSTEAWTSSITVAMDVAKATGLEEVILSAGRVSERAHMKKYGLPEEAYIMMGDYLEFSLLDAKKHDFKKVHISSLWAKMLKISMATPQTHVRYGAIDAGKAAEHLNGIGIAVPYNHDFNTAREIFDYLISTCGHSIPLLRKVCIAAKKYAEGIAAGIPVITHLVSYEGNIIADSE